MIEQRTVVVQRRTLTDLSEFLWRMVRDLTHPDELRDEAHSLAFLLSEIMCYTCTSGNREWPRYPAGMDYPQFFSQDLELLLRDLYPSGLPDDYRSVRILLAQSDRGADDGLMTPDARLEFLVKYVGFEGSYGYGRDRVSAGSPPPPRR